jgi:hypothetical protein
LICPTGARPRSRTSEAIATLVPDLAGTYTVMLTVTAEINGTTNTHAQVTRNLFVEE